MLGTTLVLTPLPPNTGAFGLDDRRRLGHFDGERAERDRGGAQRDGLADDDRAGLLVDDDLRADIGVDLDRLELR